MSFYFFMGSPMKLFNKNLIALLVLSLAVTACNKPEPAKDTPTETPKEQKTETATPSPTNTTENTSPTITMWAHSMKFSTVMAIQTAHPNLSAQQKACLLGADADATYLEKGKTEVTKILGEDGLKTSDEFYRTETGKKMQTYAKQQLQQMTGEPLAEKPVLLTDEDQKAVDEFMKTDAAKKAQAQADGMNMAEMEAMMKDLAEQETKRCGLDAK